MALEDPVAENGSNAAAIVVIVAVLLVLVMIVLWMSGAFVTPAPPGTPTP